MSTENTAKQKWWKIFAYIATFCAGFITNFSGVLENITKIPTSYHNFKETYLYDRELLKGSWSTNAEYVLNSKQLGLNTGQPIVVLTIDIDNEGGVEGEILSKKICDALPLTWIISFESEPPNMKGLFSDRSFFIKQLRNGEMQEVAELKLVNQNKRHQTITFKTIHDATGSLPDFLTLGKDLPSYKDDFADLSSHCAGSPKRFRDAIRKNTVGTKNN